jgi:hypothetical protein
VWCEWAYARAECAVCGKNGQGPCLVEAVRGRMKVVVLRFDGGECDSRR